MTTTATPQPVVQVQDLASGYDGKAITTGVGFEVHKGEVFGILGGSGSGKSTLMRNLVGLLPPIAGRILIDGQDLATLEGPGRRAVLRRLGVMYQSGALFGSMTLRENVSLPLEEHTGLPPRARHCIATAKLGLVGLAGYEDYLPEETSGGMRKRAAMARAIALDPALVFLDEPSAGLDPITSADLDQLILKLSHFLGITFVVVTHELPSIFAIVDRALVLDGAAGGMVALGTPAELRHGSTNDFVRRFFHRQGEADSSPPPGAQARNP